MKSPLLELCLDETEPPKAQIERLVRELIVSDKLPPRTRLPATQLLAKTWKAPVPTVHAALSALVKDGWLSRYHGSGTFVRERPRALKTIGIYFYGAELSHPEHRYLRAMNRCRMARIESLGMNWTVWNDPRPVEEYGKPWPAMVEAVRRGEIDAVVSPMVDLPHIGWLSNLPAPVAFSGPQSLRHSVSLDSSQLARLAVEALAGHGCRSIGLISAWPACLEAWQTADDLVPFNTFMAEVRRRGLETSDAWIVTSDRLRRTPSMSSEKWGYRAFMRLWSRPERPEGLVVITDAESLGVTMAILEKGIRVPETLRLAYHKNAEVDLFCPLPVTYVVQAADDVAAALLDGVQREFAGEKVEPAVVEFTVQEAPEEDAASGFDEAHAALAMV
ncbi:MAG: substrate-binding domain-containing protein [Kiritimatiellae bacterium]|nr:substrate-binding domain-containing protein [Kiritimatiellia bacterium]